MAQKICNECGGNGEVSITIACTHCGGNGEILQPDGTVIECPHCIYGYARVYATCPKCGGTGVVDA